MLNYLIKKETLCVRALRTFMYKKENQNLHQCAYKWPMVIKIINCNRSRHHRYTYVSACAIEIL